MKRLLLVCAFLSLLQVQAFAAPPAAGKPNIIFILADDLGILQFFR